MRKTHQNQRTRGLPMISKKSCRGTFIDERGVTSSPTCPAPAVKKFRLVLTVVGIVALLWGGVASLLRRPDVSDAAFSSLVYILTVALIAELVWKTAAADREQIGRSGIGWRSLVEAGLVGGGVVALGALALHDFLANSGVPILRHDWQWPVDQTALRELYKTVTDPWNPQSLGSPQAYPTLYPLYAIASALGLVFDPKGALNIIVLTLLFLSGSGIYWFARHRCGLGFVPTLVATTFYTYSPFVLNEFVAGHLPNLLAYSLLPWLLSLFYALNETQQLIPYLPLAALTVALSAAQIQYLILDSIALAVCAAYSVRPWRSLVLVVAIIVLSLPAQVVSLYHLLVVGPTAYKLAPATFEWLRDLSVTPTHAIALGGYIAGYADQSYPHALTGAVRLVSALSMYALIIAALLVAPRPETLPPLGFLTVGLIGATGVLDPFRWVKTYVAEHVMAANVMREYYNFEALLVLGLALATGLAVERWRMVRRPLVAYVLIIASLVFPTAFLSGRFIALLNQWREPSSYRQFAASLTATADGSRVALFPLIGPLRMVGYSFGGSDPYFSGIGGHPTLFDFNPRPEVAAVEEMFRTNNSQEGSALLGILGVRWVLLREQTVSALPEYFYHDFHNDFWPAAWLDNTYYHTIETARSLKMTKRTPEFIQLVNLDYVPIVSLGGKPFYCASTLFIDVFTEGGCPGLAEHKRVSSPERRPTVVFEPLPSREFQDARQSWVDASHYFFLGPVFAAAKGRGIVTTQPHAYVARFVVAKSQAIYVHCASRWGLRILLDGSVIHTQACRDERLAHLSWVHVRRKGHSGHVTLILQNLGGPSLVESIALVPGDAPPEVADLALYCLPRSKAFQNAHISFVRRSSTRLEGSYSSRQPVYLLFSESYDVHWLVYVGETVYHPVRVNGFENAYVVPAGHHRFVIQFTMNNLERALGILQMAFWPSMLLGCCFTRRRVRFFCR